MRMLRANALRSIALGLAASLGSWSCRAYAPLDDSGLYASCYDGSGICLGADVVADTQRALLESATCQAGLSCVPRALVTGALPIACASLAGAEGRCLLARLPLVAKQRASLPTSFCRADERCAPCYDPFSGEPTGACSLPGDPGPALPAKIFGHCCSDAGRCLPASLVASDQQDSLARNECEASELCVPQAVIDQTASPSCSSIGGAEGRCLPTCLPTVAQQLDRLPQASCSSAQRCTPCADPLSGQTTGACELPGDKGPIQPPVTLARCCQGAGRCLPSELVDDGQRDNLAQGECPNQQLCAPQSLIDKQPAHACASVAGAEGRCLPTCLVSIAKQLDTLPSSSCAPNQRCAPCFDPLSGKPSGACSLPGDPGPSQPVVIFARCCQGTGRCLPAEQVSTDQRDNLAQAECAAAELCTPQAFIDGTAATSCMSVGSFEGRCLPSCLPLVAAHLDVLPRAGCSETERCAPCYDPFAGKATGACAGPGDSGPQRPPGVFAGCCDMNGAKRGRCVPPELVPEDKGALLGAETCGSGALCLPTSLEPPATSLPACTSANVAGACVPACLLSTTQMLLSTQGDCKAWEKCVPCQIAGVASGVCPG